jgi:hypothetical protein
MMPSSICGAKMNGFTDDQIIEIRKGGASWDKINVLAVTAQQIAANSGIEAETLRLLYSRLH